MWFQCTSPPPKCFKGFLYLLKSHISWQTCMTFHISLCCPLLSLVVPWFFFPLLVQSGLPGLYLISHPNTTSAFKCKVLSYFNAFFIFSLNTFMSTLSAPHSLTVSQPQLNKELLFEETMNKKIMKKSGTKRTSKDVQIHYYYFRC